MKDTDQRTLEQTIGVKGGEIKAKVILTAPANVSLKEFILKFLQMFNWMRAPEQTQLDFSGASRLYGATIRVDKIGKTAKECSFGLVAPIKTPGDRQAANELFALMQAGRTVDLRILAVPKKEPAKKKEEKKPE